ncbi:MAG: hypothetical protein AAGN82_06450 [Myxococcota bacterium]
MNEGALEDAETAVKRAERRASMPPLALMLLAPVVVLGVVQPWKKRDAEAPAERDASANDDMKAKLESFRFASPEAMRAHFGAEGMRGFTVEGSRQGRIASVKIGWSDGPYPSFSMQILPGSKFDHDTVERRLRELVPDAGPRIELGSDRAQLRYRVTQMSIQTWIRDEPEALRAVNALWAVGRYALFGGERPDASSLERVRGKPLARAAEVDLTVPVERASASIMKVFPAAVCRTVTDAASRSEEVRCKTEVDHPFIRDITFAWPNEAQGKVRAVQMFLDTKQKQLASLQVPVERCLAPALGAGEMVVTDHAAGTGHLRFDLGSEGDHVRVEPLLVRVAGDPERAADAPATWTPRFAAVTKALAECTP